jgi:hypothetical protein
VITPPVIFGQIKVCFAQLPELQVPCKESVSGDWENDKKTFKQLLL